MAHLAIDLADINGETPLISQVKTSQREENSRKPVHFEETLTMDPGHIRSFE